MLFFFIRISVYTAINCCSWKLETMDRRFLACREGIRKAVVEKYKKNFSTIKTEYRSSVLFIQRKL